MDYMQLLKRAEERITREAGMGERFKIPKAKVIIQGNFTIITNFSEIVTALNRVRRHVSKFLLRELAVPGEIKDNRLVLQGKIREDKINEKIEKYVKEFVFCPVCGKPDTKLIEEDGVPKIKCEACGAKKVVKKI